jgi:hypothetical protein
MWEEGTVWKMLKRVWIRHYDFSLLVILVTAFDAMALLLFRPGGYILEWWGYYMPHTGFVLLSDQGLYPYVHYWMEYPPLLSWLPVAAYRLSLLFPVWNHPWLWYNLCMGALMLPFQVGNLVLVYLIAHKVYGRQTALRCAVFYAALFVPLFTWLGWFDGFPLFFLLLGLYLIVIGRPLLAGLVTGIGFMTKLMPILLAPVGWQVFQPFRRRSWLYIGATLVTILVIALPFVLIRADLFVASFVNMLTRPSWETVWALLDGYFTGGVVAPLEQRFDPATASLKAHASTLPWLLISVVFALVYLVVYTRRIQWQDSKRILAFTGLSVNLFFLYSKGFSPQFLVYLLPFVVLLLPGPKGVAYALLLSVVNLMEWPIAQLVLPNQHWLLASAILLRTLLMLGLAVEYGLVLFGPVRSRVWRAVLLLPAIVALAGVGVTGGLALRAYYAGQYAQDPYQEAMGFLREQGDVGVVIANESLYHRFYPFLGSSASLRLVDGSEHSLEQLAKLAAQHDIIWVVDIGTDSEREIVPVIEQWLSMRYYPMDSRWLESSRLSSYAAGETPPLAPEGTDFGGRALLVALGLEQGPFRPGQAIRVALSWQALTEIEEDYAVFLHLVSPDGVIWSQRDSQPVGGFQPTSGWTLGEVIRDNHALHLGSDVPAGEYHLMLGLYHVADGQRLILADQGPGAQGDALDLGPLAVLGPEE